MRRMGLLRWNNAKVERGIEGDRRESRKEMKSEHKHWRRTGREVIEGGDRQGEGEDKGWMDGGGGVGWGVRQQVSLAAPPPQQVMAV